VPVLKLRLASSALSQLADRGGMKLYKTESRDLVRRFRCHEISLPFCISRLGMALDRFLPRMKVGDIDELRAEMLANNEAVMKELADAP